MNEDSICRLCLRVTHNGMLIDETARQMLDVLLVKMNLDVSNNPLMCEKCSEIIKKSLYFILTCLDSERTLLLSNINDNKTDVDMNDVYAYKSNQFLDRDYAICRFCIQKVEERNFIPLDVLLKESTFADMVKAFMFQMDLNFIQHPLICLQCQDDMERYFKFLQNCHDTEAKINMYRRNKGKKIVLKNVIEMFFKRMKKKDTSNLMIKKIKKEYDMEHEAMSDHMPCSCDTKDSSCFRYCARLKKTVADIEYIKVETLPSEVSNQNVAINESAGLQRSPQKDDKSEICMCEKRSEMCFRCNSQFEIVSTKPTVYKCKLCPYQGTNIELHLLKQHISEVQIYRCASCEYQAKRIWDLKRHLMIHKDFSEVQMHQCDSCEFQTRHHGNLIKHQVIHKNFSEVQMYRCNSCKFQTKHHGNLIKHQVTHKNFSEVQVHQCDTCEYQTKRKGDLKKHLLRHKDFSEVQMHHCDCCEFRTKHKGNLIKHKATHKDFSEVPVHQCDSCEYHTIRKDDLKKHLLTHKNFCEVEIYQCDSCDYQTKRKHSLKRHLLTHKDFSEVPVYRCDRCEYQAKRKADLKRHLLTHKEFPEVQIYQCDSCDYQAKLKGWLKIHLLTHKDFSELKTYQCDRCGYQTKRKGDLKKHLLTHKDFSELQRYLCDRCEYRTKRKGDLNKHLLTHDNVSD